MHSKTEKNKKLLANQTQNKAIASFQGPMYVTIFTKTLLTLQTIFPNSSSFIMELAVETKIV